MAEACAYQSHIVKKARNKGWCCTWLVLGLCMAEACLTSHMAVIGVCMAEACLPITWMLLVCAWLRLVLHVTWLVLVCAWLRIVLHVTWLVLVCAWLRHVLHGTWLLLVCEWLRHVLHISWLVLVCAWPRHVIHISWLVLQLVCAWLRHVLHGTWLLLVCAWLRHVLCITWLVLLADTWLMLFVSVGTLSPQLSNVRCILVNNSTLNTNWFNHCSFILISKLCEDVKSVVSQDAILLIHSLKFYLVPIVFEIFWCLRWDSNMIKFELNFILVRSCLEHNFH